MPPLALIEPETGRCESILRNSLPSKSHPVIFSSSFFISGISLSGDSIIPLDSSVSGKAACMYAAKRASLASASSISLIPNSSFLSSSALSFNQKTSLASAMSATTGCSTFSFVISILPPRKNLEKIPLIILHYYALIIPFIIFF